MVGVGPLRKPFEEMTSEKKKKIFLEKGDFTNYAQKGELGGKLNGQPLRPRGRGGKRSTNAQLERPFFIGSD